MRRLGVIALIGVTAALPACASPGSQEIPCRRDGNHWNAALAAQTVPSATYLPCVRPLPTGWALTASRFENGSYTAWLDSDRAGVHAVEIRLTPFCDVSQAVEVRVPDALTGVRTFEHPVSLSPGFSADRYVTFDGGCVTYAFRFMSGASPTLALEVQQALDLLPREAVRRFVEGFGLTLCGAGAPPCPG